MRPPSPAVYAADRVFDGQVVLPDHAVVVNGGVVAAVVPRSHAPRTLPVYAVPKTTILPGLTDIHAHLMRWEAPLWLAYGVTTIRDVGNDLAWVLARRAEAPHAVSPTILCVGPLLDGPQPVHPLVSRACIDLPSAVAAVRETAAAGVDGIKLYCGLPGEWLPAMVREAHAAGLRASMHCQGGGVLVAGRAGVDEFFHLDGVLRDVWPDHPPGWLNVWGLPGWAETTEAQQRVADEIRALGMVATPTLAYWHSQWRLRRARFTAARDAPHVPPQMLAWQRALSPDAEAADRWRRALEAAQQFTGLLVERGVRVLAGSDTPCGALTPGLSLWREMSLLVGSSMSPVQALRAATSDAAAFLERPGLGRLAPGCMADLVIVRGDPTRRIPTRPGIVATVHHGTLHPQAELLAEAQRLADTVNDDPWSAQFRMHCGTPGGA